MTTISKNKDSERSEFDKKTDKVLANSLDGTLIKQAGDNIKGLTDLAVKAAETISEMSEKMFSVVSEGSTMTMSEAYKARIYGQMLEETVDTVFSKIRDIII